MVHLTSHKYDVSMPALTSSIVINLPSYGPIQVPTGIATLAETP